MLNVWYQIGNNSDVGFNPYDNNCRTKAIIFFCANAFPACDNLNNTLVPCWGTCANYYNNCNANDMLDWKCDPYCYSYPPKSPTDPLTCTGQ